MLNVKPNASIKFVSNLCHIKILIHVGALLILIILRYDTLVMFFQWTNFHSTKVLIKNKFILAQILKFSLK